MCGMLMLIDAASLWYRAYYALPSSIKAPAGPGRAPFAASSTAWRCWPSASPTGMVCCLEGNWRPSWRTDLIDGYKAARVAEDGTEDTPEGLDEQVAAIEALLPALGVATASHPDFEADDVIATLAARTAEPVAIVTGDRDLFQLVDDERGRTVVYLARGISKAELFDAEAVTAKFGVAPDHYVDFAVLRGDSSDGLPGSRASAPRPPSPWSTPMAASPGSVPRPPTRPPRCPRASARRSSTPASTWSGH
ncbi:hypothetical protein GCM10029992_43950 [Glycomyces albus]